MWSGQASVSFDDDGLPAKPPAGFRGEAGEAF
jgi:hypothetical protein